MEETRFSPVLCALVFLSLLVPAAGASAQYTCYDFDPGGRSVQVALAPGGRFFAVAVPDSGVIGLFTAEGSPLWTYRTGGHITGIALSDDGHTVAASSHAGDLYLLDADGNLLWNRSGLGCDNRVALTGEGTRGYVFNAGTKESPYSDTFYQFHGNGTFSVEKSLPHLSTTALTPDGTYLAGSIAEVPYEHDIALLSGDGTLLWRRPLAPGWYIHGVALSDDGSTIAAVKDHGISIFNRQGVATGNITPKYLAKSIAVSPDGRFVAAGTQYKVLCYDPNGTLLWEYTLGEYIYHTAFSGDSRYLAAASETMVYFFDRNGTLVWKDSLAWKDPLRDTVDSLSVSRDGRVVVAGTRNNTIYVFDETGKSTLIQLGILRPGPLPAAAEAPAGSLTSRTPVPSMTVTSPATEPAILPVTASIGAFSILVIIQILRRKGG